MRMGKKYMIEIMFAVIIVLVTASSLLIKNWQNNSGEFRFLSIKPEGNLSIDKLPAVLIIEIKTGGENARAICYYSNTPETRWVEFHETGNTKHKQSFMFPYYGKKEISIRCENDENEILTKTDFSLEKILK